MRAARVLGTLAIVAIVVVAAFQLETSSRIRDEVCEIESVDTDGDGKEDTSECHCYPIDPWTGDADKGVSPAIVNISECD